MNLAAWLRRLGLERYEQAFRDHALDVDVLSELNEADFAELGVRPADREKLVEAITRTLRNPIKLRPKSQDQLPIASAPTPNGGS